MLASPAPTGVTFLPPKMRHFQSPLTPSAEVQGAITSLDRKELGEGTMGHQRGLASTGAGLRG